MNKAQKFFSRILGINSQIKKLKFDLEKKTRQNVILQRELDSIRDNEQNEAYPKKLVYTDSEGNNFYAYSGNDLPNSRKVIIQSLIDSMRFGIEPDDLFENLDKITLKVKNLSKTNVETESIQLIADLARLKAKTQNVIQPNLYLKTALAITWMEGEPEKYDNTWMEKKFELWDKDENAHYFFLCWVGILIDESRNWSPISVQKYLLENNLKINPYSPIL